VDGRLNKIMDVLGMDALGVNFSQASMDDPNVLSFPSITPSIMKEAIKTAKVVIKKNDLRIQELENQINVNIKKENYAECERDSLGRMMAMARRATKSTVMITVQRATKSMMMPTARRAPTTTTTTVEMATARWAVARRDTTTMTMAMGDDDDDDDSDGNGSGSDDDDCDGDGDGDGGGDDGNGEITSNNTDDG